MRILLLILIIGPFSILLGQPMNTIEQPDEVILEIAKERMEAKDYYNALEWYEKYYNEVKKDIQIEYKIATLEYLLRDFKKAERSYAKIVRKIDRAKKRKSSTLLINSKDNIDIRFHYARVLKMNGKYQKSIDQFKLLLDNNDNTLLALVKSELKGAELARSLSKNSKVKITNLGDKINSPSTDASPVFHSAKKTLYFASFNRDDLLTLKDNEEENYHIKIYKSKKENNTWSTPSLLPTGINVSGYHISSPTFSLDEKTLFFTRSIMDGMEIKESSIFSSQLKNDKWNTPQEVISSNKSSILKHPAIGKVGDQEVLFFVSDMPGGEGGDDIYYVRKMNDGNYGEAKNLGSIINTAGNDLSPFYQDGVLYFSSDGHPNIGGHDIFKSTLNGRDWSMPKNLGIPINSSYDDLFYNVNKLNNQGFLVSNRPGGKSIKSSTCCDDIYSFTKETINLKLLVEVFDVNDKKPLLNPIIEFARVIEDQPSDNITFLDKNLHSAKFDLQVENFYQVIVSKPGYFSDTIYTNTVGFTQSKEINEQIFLKPIPVAVVPSSPPISKPDTINIVKNKPIRLSNIYYDFDDDKILKEAEKDLNAILKLLNQYPSITIELSSHTDAQGNDQYNKLLSQKRADSAKNWLTNKNINSSRIQAVGYGEQQILNHCKNGKPCKDEEHRYNRRTEFKIIGGPSNIKFIY